MCLLVLAWEAHPRYRLIVAANRDEFHERPAAPLARWPPPEDILAVRDWQSSDRLNAADKAILAATDECLAGKSISDAAWAEVAKHITDPAHQVEFVIAMGNWLMFSMLFRNLRIPLGEGVAVWPPDGQASPAANGWG